MTKVQIQYMIWSCWFVAGLLGGIARLCHAKIRADVMRRTSIPNLSFWTEGVTILQEHQRLFPTSRLRLWRSLLSVIAACVFITPVLIAIRVTTKR